MSTLRTRTIKLAQDRPELRPHLLPLLGQVKQAAASQGSFYIRNGFVVLTFLPMGEDTGKFAKQKADLATGVIKLAIEGTAKRLVSEGTLTEIPDVTFGPPKASEVRLARGARMIEVVIPAEPKKLFSPHKLLRNDPEASLYFAAFEAMKKTGFRESKAN